jgi:hypothetical protein
MGKHKLWQKPECEGPDPTATGRKTTCGPYPRSGERKRMKERAAVAKNRNSKKAGKKKEKARKEEIRTTAP